MHRDDVPLAFPCGADFSTMTRLERGRLCAQCDTVVHDLSSMTEGEARATLGSRENARLCVRYLYDANGRVVFAGDVDVARAKIVPEHRLTSRLRNRIAKAALLAAPLLLIEACGGNAGNYNRDDLSTTPGEDAGNGSTDPHHPAHPTVGDGGTDADAQAATDAAADGPDASPPDAGSD